jgi:hypothetical protein
MLTPDSRSIIIDYLEQNYKSNDVGVAYIYCNYKERGQTAANLASSLLQQLVEQQPVVSESITALYDNHVKRLTRPSLVEISSSVQREARHFSRVYLVVDAMDECSESDRTRDIFLRELQSLPSNFRLLVTSRYISDIERYFGQVARLNILAPDDDVKRYIEAQIQGQPRLANYVRADAVLKETIISTITERTHGM